MIKNWIQFIKESVDSKYWISIGEIREILHPLTDQDYTFKIEHCMFDLEKVIIAKDEVLKLGDSTYIGYCLEISHSTSGGKSDDVTDDFKNFLSAVRNQGYIVKDIYDEDGNISPDYLYFKDGEIITWIPEKEGKPISHSKGEWSDGDIFINSNMCRIFFYQEDPINVSQIDLANFYGWKNYEINGSDIFFNIDIDDLATYSLERDSRWVKLLMDGLSSEDYYNSDYQPDIQSLFNYDLDNTAGILAIKCVFKEIGGWEDLNLGKTEDEVIKFLLKERYYKTLKDVCKYSEIIGELQSLYADYASQAHCDTNEKEMYETFDELLNDNGIDWKKEWKLGKKYYYRTIPGTNRKEKVWYDENMWVYQIYYDEKWVSEYAKTGAGWSLCDVFTEWMGDSYMKSEMEPNFSDYGDVDRNQFNAEAKRILEDYLKK